MSNKFKILKNQIPKSANTLSFICNRIVRMFDYYDINYLNVEMSRIAFKVRVASEPRDDGRCHP